MATINDYGGSSDTLASPSLSDWAGAVADMLNAHDTDIDSMQSADTWTAYVPTVAGCVASSVVAEYVKHGRTVTVMVKLTLTSMAGAPTISAPVAPDANQSLGGLGIARMTAGGVYYGMVSISGSGFAIQSPGTNGAGVAITPTVPGTWASGSTISFTVTYKSAT